ncbi:MAG: Por secretion system C-terminal sorting protein, partial [Bacteroidetes bacterium]|nr:Por secretion system C-terminal sorting protein [Bacteroidota bacterium]
LAVNQPVGLTFRWARTESAVAYILQIGTDSTFTEGVFFADSSVADTFLTVMGFDHNTRYFWRVGAKNAGGIGLYSSTWSFTTGLDQVALVAPADGVVNLPRSVELSWFATPGATAYHVQLSPDSLFGSGLVLDEQQVVDTFLVAPDLAHDTRYFWRVAAQNADGAGSFSQPRSFRTIVAVPSKIELASPAEGAVLTSNVIVLSWHPGAPAIDRYAVEVAADSLFSSSMTDSTIIDTSRSVTVPAASGTYWWRARAHNVAGWGPYSDPRKAVLLIMSAEDDKVVPGEFSLGQNYPNPFNPSTSIQYGLPVRSFVTLTVYNMLGQEVATLIEGEREAGYHTAKFDARNLASGVYLYRLQAKREDGNRGGDFVQTRRLLLVR